VAQAVILATLRGLHANMGLMFKDGKLLFANGGLSFDPNCCCTPCSNCDGTPRYVYASVPALTHLSCHLPSGTYRLEQSTHTCCWELKVTCDCGDTYLTFGIGATGATLEWADSGGNCGGTTFWLLTSSVLFTSPITCRTMNLSTTGNFSASVYGYNPSGMLPNIHIDPEAIEKPQGDKPPCGCVKIRQIEEKKRPI
jgi:hypothetical protein